MTNAELDAIEARAEADIGAAEADLIENAYLSSIPPTTILQLVEALREARESAREYGQWLDKAYNHLYQTIYNLCEPVIGDHRELSPDRGVEKVIEKLMKLEGK